MIRLAINIKRLRDKEWEYVVKEDGLLLAKGTLESEEEAFQFAVQRIATRKGYQSFAVA
jgi:hypothetical protein